MVLRLIEEDWPLDEIVFFDTGWEFPQMYEHIEKVEAYIGRKITRLHPRRDFETWMLRRKIIARKGPMKGKVHRIGNGWPSPSRRWCTRENADVLDKHCRGAVQYVGIAADEATRTTSANLIGKGEKRYPLVDWGVDEPQALAYCKARGFDWGGLYEIFRRVSCFCCPLQRLGELRMLRRHLPELWGQMLAWEDEMGEHCRGFKDYTTVHDLDERFEMEDRQAEFPQLRGAYALPGLCMANAGSHRQEEG